MLPTTGRFKNFNCPFYETCICERPYCHFKHTKKEAVNDTNLISELVSKAVHKVLNSNLSSKSDAIPEKSDESVVTATTTTSVTYNPTPIAQLNKIKSTATPTTTTTAAAAAATAEKKSRHIPIQYTPEQPRSSRSAPKLEYTIPDYSSNTSAGYSPSVNNYSSAVSYVPSSIKTLTSSYNKNESGTTDADQKGQIYVPSNVNSTESYTNLGSPSATVKYSPTRNLGVVDNIDNEYVPKYNDEFIDDFLNDPNIYEPTEILSKKSEKTEKSNSTSKYSGTGSSTAKSDDKSKKHSSSKSSSSSSRSKSKESESKSSSSSKHSSRDKHKSKESDQKNGCDKKHKSSSDKHKHSKSSSDSHKSSSDSHKSSSDSHKSSSDSHKSSSDSHKSSSDSHKSRERDKHKSSSDSKSKSKDKQSEKDKSNDKVKSSEKSKSSSKSVSNDKDKVSKDKHKSKTKQPVEDVPPVYDDMDYDDYPDDISDYESDEMEQCKRIFEEYQAPVEVPQPEIKVPAKSSNSDPSTISKKRVAHDKSSTVYREKQTKAPPAKNAALVMTNRYKIIQAQIEQQNRENENKAAQAFAAKQLKQGLKRSIEYQQQVANIFEEKSPDNQHQAISSKIKRIAHVPNVSSLLNAKKKMDEKSTKEVVKTPTQTVSKGNKRVAHTPELSFADIPTVLQSERSKLPVNVRSRYLFLMTKECVKLYVSKQAAYDRALNEELNCYSKCSTINTYKNSIMLSINRVRKEAESGNSLNGSSSHLDNSSEFEGKKLYNNLLRWALSEDDLVENGFPRTGAAKKGHAVFKINKTIERIPEQCQLCVRCKKIFRVDEFGFPVFQEDCIYHPLNRFVFRGETRYICCKQPASSDGCCICSSHVFEIRDPSELTGFVSTFEPEDENDPRNTKVYALDCEMVYTTRGCELARVTVIDSKCDVVYESFVKPLGYILDYNTRFSGLTLEMLENVTKKITEVQATLLLIFNSKTILVGHSLESDLKALRIIHDTVVDTSVLFPHKMGPPRKRALRNLASDYLKKIIQNDESGHDSAEDAITCMELLVWKLKEELKTR